MRITHWLLQNHINLISNRFSRQPIGYGNLFILFIYFWMIILSYKVVDVAYVINDIWIYAPSTAYSAVVWAHIKSV